MHTRRDKLKMELHMEKVYTRKIYVHGGELQTEEINMEEGHMEEVPPKERYTWRGPIHQRGCIYRRKVLMEGPYGVYNIHNYRRDIHKRDAHT